MVKTDWDYTELAPHYLKRPQYAEDAIREMLTISGTRPGDRACDVGAGVAHLTLLLAQAGLAVVAVEPNDAMRALGIERTRGLENVVWIDGTGEKTGQADAAFRLVTFGSSFNVVDQPEALRESRRILGVAGWFACMWNHRDLSDPLQREIEEVILSFLPAYDYGARRTDQSEVIRGSGLFNEVITIERKVTHSLSVDEWLYAWRSHATLSRQAGDRFPAVIAGIERLVSARRLSQVEVPYQTRIWMAQVRG